VNIHSASQEITPPFMETNLKSLRLSRQWRFKSPLCSVVVGHQCFRGLCCLQLHCKDGRTDIWNLSILPQN